MNTELNEVKTDFVICAEDGRCLLRIDLRAGKVEGSLGDMGEAARVFVEHVRAMLGASTAALSSPPADDVREALASRLERSFGSFLSHWPHDPDRFFGGAADEVMAAFEVRPYGTVTDTAHDRDGVLICRKCGQGITALDVVDGEKPCPGARGTVTDAEERWEYGCRSSSHSGFMRSVATWDDETTWREHLTECPSPAPVIRRAAGEWEARS